MAGNRLTSRVEALEGAGRGFGGFAVIDIWQGRTVEQAKAEWEAKYGPIGDRQVLLYNFGGLSDAAA